jgi:hypothetical protein
MNQFSRRCIGAITLCLLTVTSAWADPLVDQVTLVASASAARSPVPAAQTFTVTEAGSYVITLTDLASPAPLQSLMLAVAQSESAAAMLSTAGSQTVTLQPGLYTVQPLATASSGSLGGSFSVQVAPAGGGANLWQYQWSVSIASAAAQPGQSYVQTEFSVATAGTYQLNVVDQAFPAALSSLQLIILPHGVANPVPVSPTPISGPNISTPLTLAAGNYDLFIIANANSTALAGIYSVNISQGTAASTVFATVIPVGQLIAPLALNIPSSGNLTLQVSDLATPAPLASLQFLLTEGSSVLQPAAGTGSYAVNALAGTAQLYVLASPSGTSGAGAYEAYLTGASGTVADVVVPVLASGDYGYAFSSPLAAAGTYTLNVTDFQLPVPLAGVSAVAIQRGTVLTSNANGGSFSAVAGPLNILVFPTLEYATANSLFGVQIQAPGSAAPVYQLTQGVGALFYSETFTVPASGTFGMTLTDLGFPDQFGQIAVIATGGTNVEGEIFGGGQVALDLPAGTYVLNVLSSVNSAAEYGLYGLDVSQVPAVSLTAADGSVASGQATTLSWLSSNASSCVASGGWSGTLPASGSQSTGPVTTATTFTITCTGLGGSAHSSAEVTIAAPGTSGGGGSLSPLALLILTVSALAMQSRQRL